MRRRPMPSGAGSWSNWVFIGTERHLVPAESTRPIRRQIADAAPSAVGSACAACAACVPRQSAPSSGDSSAAEDARKIGDLYASFRDTAAIAAKGLDPIRQLLAAGESLSDVRDQRPGGFATDVGVAADTDVCDVVPKQVGDFFQP